MAAPDPMHLFRMLLAGELSVARLYFAGTPSVADPLEGDTAAGVDWQHLLKAKSRWLRAHKARLQPLAVTRGPVREVAEAIAYLRVEKRTVPLPIAVVADLDGGKWKSVRVYHSTLPLTGKSPARDALLPSDPALVIPDVVGKYHAALREGDLDGLIATFAPSGYAREPRGGEFAHQGKDALRAAYARAVEHSVGKRLAFCTVTDDGVRTALEYNRTAQGAQPSMPGISVYERSPAGLISALRNYDDALPPDEWGRPAA